MSRVWRRRWYDYRPDWGDRPGFAGWVRVVGWYVVGVGVVWGAANWMRG